jgi:hypothetical protein
MVFAQWDAGRRVRVVKVQLSQQFMGLELRIVA